MLFVATPEIFPADVSKMVFSPRVGAAMFDAPSTPIERDLFDEPIVSSTASEEPLTLDELIVKGVEPEPSLDSDVMLPDPAMLNEIFGEDARIPKTASESG